MSKSLRLYLFTPTLAYIDMQIIPDNAPAEAIPIKDKMPSWFIALNVLALGPILAWPIVFFASNYIFNAMGDMFPRVLLWYAIILYPIYIIGFVVLNFWLYRRRKTLALLLLLLYYAFALKVVFTI